jgi:hypothetical protein
MNRILQVLMLSIALAIAGMAPAAAALYTGSYGSLVPSGSGDPSDCDDCYSSFIAFPGGGTINYFGTTYSGVYVGSNGYVTFGNGVTHTYPGLMTTETDAPMIGAFANDLYSGGDASSNVYYNDLTAGQLIITWENMGHCCSYTYHSTFQVVIRTDQFAVPGGEGQVGFFFGSIDDNNYDANIGLGEGTRTSYIGEINYSASPGSSYSNHAPIWIASVPHQKVQLAIPTLSQWGLLILSIMLAMAAVFAQRRQH